MDAKGNVNTSKHIKERGSLPEYQITCSANQAAELSMEFQITLQIILREDFRSAK